MAGIFHKGIRYSGFGNLWGMIKGNIASQTDLKEALDSIDEKASKDQYIIRNGVTASAGQIVRIPASGYDDRIRNSDGYEAQVVAGSLLSAVKISALRIINVGSIDEDTGRTIYNRYAEITLAEGITNTDIGLKITKIGDNSNYLRPVRFDVSDEIIIQGYTYSGKSVSAYGYADWETDVTLAGYRPLGLIRWAIYGQTDIVTIYTTINEDNTTGTQKGRIRVRNISGNAISNVSGDMAILYKKL